jgi:hypothetical protein
MKSIDKRDNQSNVILDKPNLNTKEAAIFINCSPYTLRLSRSTGKLFGVDAPLYKKRNRSVVYSRSSLELWENQFEEIPNTSALNS